MSLVLCNDLLWWYYTENKDCFSFLKKCHLMCYDLVPDFPKKILRLRINQKPTQIMQILINVPHSQRADVALAGFSMTRERFKVMDFSEPVGESSGLTGISLFLILHILVRFALFRYSINPNNILTYFLH